MAAAAFRRRLLERRRGGVDAGPHPLGDAAARRERRVGEARHAMLAHALRELERLLFLLRGGGWRRAGAARQQLGAGLRSGLERRSAEGDAGGGEGSAAWTRRERQTETAGTVRRVREVLDAVRVHALRQPQRRVRARIGRGRRVVARASAASGEREPAAE